MEGQYYIYCAEGRFIQVLVGKPGEIDHSEDLDIHGRIILQLILKL